MKILPNKKKILELGYTSIKLRKEEHCDNRQLILIYYKLS